MGLIHGSGSFTRFKTQGPLSPKAMEEIPGRIRRFAFQNIDEMSVQERSAGWVNILDMFDSRFAAKEYLKEPCVAMAWRVDVRKVPSKALMQHCREVENGIREAENLEFLPKKRREEIREGIRMKLMTRAIPRSQTFDMIWNVQTGMILFGATSNRICDEFMEFFLTCFGLQLESVFPYSAASDIIAKSGMDLESLDSLRPSLMEAF